MDKKEIDSELKEINIKSIQDEPVEDSETIEKAPIYEKPKRGRPKTSTVCEYCNKQYSTNSNMHKHMRKCKKNPDYKKNNNLDVLKQKSSISKDVENEKLLLEKYKKIKLKKLENQQLKNESGSGLMSYVTPLLFSVVGGYLLFNGLDMTSKHTEVLQPQQPQTQPTTPPPPQISQPVAVNYKNHFL